MKKKLLTYIVPAAVLLAIAGTGLAAHAASTTGKTNPMSSLVAAIAQKFNLNTSDVQQVFDDQRATMEKERGQNETSRINQAVTDGKLTQAQANLIIAKRAELQAARTSLEGKTPAEKMAAMKTQMESLKQWATDNSIPAGYLMFGGRGHGGFHGHFGPAN